MDNTEAKVAEAQIEIEVEEPQTEQAKPTDAPVVGEEISQETEAKLSEDSEKSEAPQPPTETVEDAEKPKMQVVKVEKDPAKDLKVILGRQNADYWTTPGWPSWEEMKKPVNYIVRGDGLYEVRINSVGVFCVPRASFKLPGFPKEENGPFFALKNGPIPYTLLQEILYFFKKICDDSKDEVYMQIFWNPETEEYYNYCPIQKVSGGSVEYERDSDLEANHVLVLEIHSHNTMGAYFSSIDDRDEKSDRFFGVVGELNRSRPAMKFSYVCGGTRVEIPASGIFEEAPEEEDLFPLEWLKRVTKRHSYSPFRGQTSGYPGEEGISTGSYRHASASASSGNTGGGATPSAFAHKATKEAGSRVHSTTGRSISEIEREIEEAAQRASREIDGSDFLDESLQSVDFLGDDREPGVSDSANPFFPSSTSIPSGEASVDNEQYDEAIEALIGTVEEMIIQHYAVEEKMQKNKAEKLFAGLVASLSEEDIETLVEQVVDQGHVEIICDALQIEIPEEYLEEEESNSLHPNDEEE